MFVTLPARGVTAATFAHHLPAASTIPYFTGSITSPLDHHRYTFHIVGTNPVTQRVTTSIGFVPIIMRVHFPDGTVLDPTQPGCNDTVSVAQRFFGSPLFQNTTEISNGVNVGNTQLLDAFQRAETWSFTAGSNYHVLLARSGRYNVVDVNAPSGSVTSPGACSGSAHNLGQIDINAYDSILTNLIDQYATVTQIPVPLSYNVVETEGGCCVLGYRSAYQRSGGVQVYASAAYTDAGIFSGIEDIDAYSAELGDLFDDPFGDNATPGWPVAPNGCQNDLEVGEPLSVTFALPLNGFTYNPRELTFFDWFFRTPSHGTGGKYSYQGTFTSPPRGC